METGIREPEQDQQSPAFMQPDKSEPAAGFEFAHGDGTVHRAADASVAIARCSFLAEQSKENPDAVRTLLELGALGSKMIAASQTDSEKRSRPVRDTADGDFWKKALAQMDSKPSKKSEAVAPEQPEKTTAATFDKPPDHVDPQANRRVAEFSVAAKTATENIKTPAMLPGAKKPRAISEQNEHAVLLPTPEQRFSTGHEVEPERNKEANLIDKFFSPVPMHQVEKTQFVSEEKTAAVVEAERQVGSRVQEFVHAAELTDKSDETIAYISTEMQRDQASYVAETADGQINIPAEAVRDYDENLSEITGDETIFQNSTLETLKETSEIGVMEVTSETTEISAAEMTEVAPIDGSTVAAEIPETAHENLSNDMPLTLELAAETDKGAETTRDNEQSYAPEVVDLYTRLQSLSEQPEDPVGERAELADLFSRDLMQDGPLPDRMFEAAGVDSVEADFTEHIAEAPHTIRDVLTVLETDAAEIDNPPTVEKLQASNHRPLEQTFQLVETFFATDQVAEGDAEIRQAIIEVRRVFSEELQTVTAEHEANSVLSIELTDKLVGLLQALGHDSPTGILYEYAAANTSKQLRQLVEHLYVQPEDDIRHEQLHDRTYVITPDDATTRFSALLLSLMLRISPAEDYQPA